MQESSSLGTSLSFLCWADLHLAETLPPLLPWQLWVVPLSGIYHTLLPSDIKEEPLWGTEGCVWKRCQALEEEGEEAESTERGSQAMQTWQSLGQSSTCQGSLHRAEGSRSWPRSSPTLLSPGLGLPGKEWSGLWSCRCLLEGQSGAYLWLPQKDVHCTVTTVMQLLERVFFSIIHKLFLFYLREESNFKIKFRLYFNPYVHITIKVFFWGGLKISSLWIIIKNFSVSMIFWGCISNFVVTFMCTGDGKIEVIFWWNLAYSELSLTKPVLWGTEGQHTASPVSSLTDSVGFSLFSLVVIIIYFKNHLLHNLNKVILLFVLGKF